MNQTAFVEQNDYLGLAYGFRGLVHCGHGGKHGNTLADTVWERHLRALHSDTQAAGSELS